ncbi:MAG: argininosuccinate lyase [Acidimicrobiia bacterium]|nr:argininosuccinate lyase [Acidimicrobiia bacterium]NNF63480.1 argininosuccinate lyase [Acidimicrobiia bacterium]
MTLWGGRFDSAPDEVLWAYTVDTSDRRLLPDDIRGSQAHVAMLVARELLSPDEGAALQQGLTEIAREASDGRFGWLESDEDVHSAVERRLGEIVGPVAGKLHTGRSRNDQVCLDLRLYLSRSGREQIKGLARFAGMLVDKAEEVGDTIVPSYTHLQQAQAVPLAHHLLAYAEMLRRDAERMSGAVGRIEVSPLGAGASGGSSLPIDPLTSTQALGWSWHFVNSMDAVGSRDFVSEYAFCAAQAMVHLSRLAEELILWATTEFGWVTFEDAHTTGSSALPHKKNPDIAELVRGRTAAAIGDLTTVMVMQKGLPMTYNRDLQEDKRAVFHIDDTLAGSLGALGALMSGARFSPPPPSSWVTALDLAEALVLRGVPFREAHEAVGGLVSTLVAEGRDLASATESELVAADGRFIPTDVALLDVEASVRRRMSPGGGSFENVQRQISWIREALAKTLSE